MRELIEADLRKNPNNQYVIARRYGITRKAVKDLLTAMQPPGASTVAKPVTIEVSEEEIPEHLRPYVVEVKPVCAAWSRSEAIREARLAYDNGEVELCTGRIRRRYGDVLVLYKIPRRRQDTRRRVYFSAMYEG